MEATIGERENLANLNQERTSSQDSSEGLSTQESSGPRANLAETLIMLLFAGAVDFVNILDLTGFGAILTRFITLPFFGVLLLWRLLKTGLKKDATFQLIIAFLVEISPFGILPSWTIFVLYVYFKDTSIGRKTIGKTEKLSKAKAITK